MLFPGRTDPKCSVCRGVMLCKGGGNRHCRKRDPRPARIALILDTYGGIRVIVGTARSIKYNTRHDEFAHVVPKLVVHEPIHWNDIPIVVERAKFEFEKWLGTKPNLSKELHDAVTLYHLRCLEQHQKSFDPAAMVET